MKSMTVSSDIRTPLTSFVFTIKTLYIFESFRAFFALLERNLIVCVGASGCSKKFARVVAVPLSHTQPGPFPAGGGPGRGKASSWRNWGGHRLPYREVPQ